MKYDTICISGGGIYGFAVIGVIDRLISENIISLDDITTWVGTSVGAIISFIFSLGYDMEELLDFINNFDFTILIPKKIKLFNLFNTNGLSKGNKFIFAFKKFIYNKFYIEDLTFQELYDLTNKKLVIIGTNYTNNTEDVFSLSNTPDMSIITAVRISISIPVIFTPVFYNNYYYVDGCVKNHFPYNHCNNDSTLGICIVKNHINNNSSNIFNIFKITMGMIINNYNPKYYYSNIINIDYTNDYKNNIIYSDTDLSQENIHNMISYGKESINISNITTHNFNHISTQTDCDYNDNSTQTD